MKRKVRWITETDVMLALLFALQAVSRAAGQLVTGSFVNAVLATTVLIAGMSSGVTVALISPVMAYLLGIAPQFVTVPAIMIGNTVFVVLLKLISTDSLWRKIAAWLTAAAAKFVVLWLLVTKIICGIAAAPLLESGMLKAPMLEKLPAMFAWPQLATALIGAAAGLVIAPLVRRALRR